MPIDPNTESLLSLTEAARCLPRRRAGKRPHVWCLCRWTVSGCRGVILESIQIGGARCTSHEALARFFSTLTAQSGIPHGQLQPIRPRTPVARRLAIERAERELLREGL